MVKSKVEGELKDKKREVAIICTSLFENIASVEAITINICTIQA
jgi:hypothetical protein